jgi:hypothetical protein
MAYAPNTMRWGCLDGKRAVLVEVGATNLLSRAITSIATGWTLNGASGSDLALNALALFPGVAVTSNGAIWHRLVHADEPSVTNGASYHASVFFKFGTSGKLMLTLRNNANSGESRFTINSEAVVVVLGTGCGSLKNILLTPVGFDGVYRLDVNLVSNFTGTVSFGLGPGSAVIGESVVVLGAQFETGTVGTSFINTTGASATRAADLVTAPITADVSNGVRVRGTFRLDAVNGSYDRVFQIGSDAGRMTLHWAAANGAFRVEHWADWVSQGGVNVVGPEIGDTCQFDISFTPSGVVGVLAGVSFSFAGAGGYVTPTVVRLGSSGSGSNIPTILLCSEFIVTGVQA